MTEQIDKIIIALEIISTWYKCDFPIATEELNKIIKDLKESK